MMTTGVLIVAHGSPVQAANQELFDLVEQFRKQSCYALVEPAFLEGAPPSIPEAIGACVAKGAGKVVITPYFLLPGKHVQEDLPAFLADAKKRYPKVQFVLGEHLRFSDKLGQAVLGRIREANVLQWQTEPAERGEGHESGGSV
jgi:sirohydrochlorin ferrochelatase